MGGVNDAVDAHHWVGIGSSVVETADPNMSSKVDVLMAHDGAPTTSFVSTTTSVVDGGGDEDLKISELRSAVAQHTAWAKGVMSRVSKSGDVGL